MSPCQPEDVVELARQLGLQMPREEASVYSEAIEVVEARLVAMPSGLEDYPSPRDTMRDPGHRPTSDEDPYNCFITRCLVTATGHGPLSGVRLGLKDCISVAGVPMTLGSRFMEGFTPRIDATVVRRLLDSGADLVGKLNMDPFSHPGPGLGTEMGDYGRCLNPHAPDHLSGGSSSGAAVAVASGAVDLAIGGDQGGSIRVPAAWCGVVGLKPTHGLVPHTGVVGTEPSLDHIGPMARTVEDVALALECIAGPDGYDPRQQVIPAPEQYSQTLARGAEHVRIGVLREGFGDPDADPDVDSAVLEAVEILRQAGGTVGEISVPEHLTCGKLLTPLAFVGRYLFMRTYGGAFLQGHYDTDFSEAFGRFLASRADLLPPRMKLMFLVGAHLGPIAMNYYGRAQNSRRAYGRAYDAAFRDVDCLVMPTVPITAPLYETPRDGVQALRSSVLRRHERVVGRNTSPFNVTGHPALSVPCKLLNGLPVGMMLVGPRFSEGLLLRVANAFQQSVDWEKLKPQDLKTAKTM